jgi:hypothetical protein
MGTRVVLVGPQVYVFAFVPYAETARSQADACRRFFDSIVVKC